YSDWNVAEALMPAERSSRTLEATSSCASSCGCTDSGSASSVDPIGAVAKNGSSSSSKPDVPIGEGSSVTNPGCDSVEGGSSLPNPRCKSAGTSVGVGNGKSVEGGS